MNKLTKSFLKNIVVLTLITVVAGLGLALTYKLTEQKIIDSEQQEVLKSIRFVMPRDKDDKPLFKNDPDSSKITMNMDDPEGEVAKEIIIYPGMDTSGKVIGFAIKVTSRIGYGGDLGLMIGTDEYGTITETYILSMLETPGLGTKITEDSFKGQFNGKSLEAGNSLLLKKDDSNAGDIDAVTGATISSRAMTNAVRKAMKFFMDNRAEIISRIESLDQAVDPAGQGRGKEG